MGGSILSQIYTYHGGPAVIIVILIIRLSSFLRYLLRSLMTVLSLLFSAPYSVKGQASQALCVPYCCSKQLLHHSKRQYLKKNNLPN